MKSKDEVLQNFLKWKNMIENQTGRKIKRLRTDNGGEYKSDSFFDVFHEYGIVRHFTVRHTPQQNGVAEHMNRTLLEKVQCLLSNAGLGKAFWAEAVTYAGHLINRLPLSAIGGKTPLEVWSGKPATDYDSLHLFGSTAYYHVKPSKLDPRAKKVLFMEITHGVKGFHLWCLDTKKIICSRNITFDESALVKKNNTWKLAQLPKGKRAIGCKWVFVKKDGSHSKKDVCYKARLVAKVYTQKEGIDYNEVFSPVVKHSSIRILLALVAQLNLELAQLDQSLRQWYKRFDSFMRRQKYTRSKYDHCVYLQKLKDGFFIYLLLYVDDMLIASKSQKEIDKLKAQLNQELEMKDLGEAKKILERVYMAKVPYANAVGSLMYAMVCTHPDISQAVGVVSRYMHDPGEGHWQAVKWILRYLQQTVDVGLVFEQDEALCQCVVRYADSDYAGDLDKHRSTTGYLFTLAKAPEAIWLNGLMEDLGVVQSHISLYCDSQSAIHLEKNQVYHSRTKHIDVRYHFVREIFEEVNILLQKIATSENPADMMTKVRHYKFGELKKLSRLGNFKPSEVIIRCGARGVDDILIEPRKFAIGTAVYLLNIPPTKVVLNCTPHESWRGTKSSVNHLRIFCCLAYVLDVEKEDWCRAMKEENMAIEKNET
ncbi:hypothetical protein F3Y22_tig00110684pilonHSYRG00024 [Hibiscus syriacus]|uniref:Integrase catalytic domain-containing protein n=1 Tax=Hibiscus syriacus TaxID=106335 RepID=A0A6A2ZY40_HIBSY|nr:hypothetical protein F3Y22_tig00110684pilonHSYRG00024 [Hibiscus syriacus]